MDRKTTGRTIGLAHRVKQTAEQTPRPTMVSIKNPKSEKPITIKLETEQDELDFLLGRLPTKWRDAKTDEDLAGIFPRHQKPRKIKANESTSGLLTTVVAGKKKWSTETQAITVPAAYAGFRKGDKIATTLGGSGDRFTYALSRRGGEIGASVYRVPPAVLKNYRGQGDKDLDHETLVEMFIAEPDVFYETTLRDRKLIKLTEIYRGRIDAMKARMACEQRLRQRFIGQIFLSEDGRYPEGIIEDSFDALKASDPILKALLQEEKNRNKELEKAVEAMDVWSLFDPIEGVGPAIAARLIIAIGDVRRFPNEAKLKAFLGAHVLSGGKYADIPTNKQFVRRRGGQVANWHPEGRQALFLLGDQFNRRPGSKWGLKLREYKEKLRVAHPHKILDTKVEGEEPIALIEGKYEYKGGVYHITLPSGEVVKKRGTTKYSDIHIHKMATWRTTTKFVEWLWREWTNLEKSVAKEKSQDQSEAA